MSTLAHWRDRLFYAARASTVSFEPREAAELHALLEQLAAENERLKAVRTSARDDYRHDHLYVDNPTMPGWCAVKVPVSIAGRWVVGSCDGSQADHVEVDP